MLTGIREKTKELFIETQKYGVRHSLVSPRPWLNNGRGKHNETE